VPCAIAPRAISLSRQAFSQPTTNSAHSAVCIFGHAGRLAFQVSERVCVCVCIFFKMTSFSAAITKLGSGWTTAIQ
jgi:hypothetical protein